VYLCTRCGLRFLWPQPSREELDRRYLQLYFSGNPRYSMSDVSYLQQVLDRHIRKVVPRLSGLRVLDFGCGNGRMLELLRGLGAEACGVESSDESRLKASKELRLPIWKCLNDAPSSLRFDVVIMNEVIEHLTRPRTDLRCIYERIRPGGGCYVSTPNFGGLKARLAGLRWTEYDNPTHLCCFDFHSLGNLGRLAGFGDCVRLTTRVRFPSLGALRQMANRALSALRIDSGLKVFFRK
jgi:SAM-dependent methyltransferase